MERFELEEVARLALERAGVGAPVCPDALAIGLHFEIRHAPVRGKLIGRTIYVDEDLRPEIRAFDCAHELGHHLCDEAGLPNTERNANYLASAMLLPSFEYKIDLRRHGWDLRALRRLHPNASWEAHARRLAALRGARVIIWDRPLPPYDIRGKTRTVPWRAQPTHEERIAAHEAVRSNEPVEMRAGLIAWPVLEPWWHRVIVVTAPTEC
jgi:hypothetical protein